MKYQRIVNNRVVQTAEFDEDPGAGWVAIPPSKGTITAAQFVRGISKGSLRSLKTAVGSNNAALQFYELMTLEGLNLDDPETQANLDLMVTASIITQAERDLL